MWRKEKIEMEGKGRRNRWRGGKLRRCEGKRKWKSVKKEKKKKIGKRANGRKRRREEGWKKGKKKKKGIMRKEG